MLCLVNPSTRCCEACGACFPNDPPQLVRAKCGQSEVTGTGRSYPNQELPCIHRGEELRKEKCQVCGEKGMLRTVYACSIHGQCAWRKWKANSTPGVTFCNACDDLSTVGQPLTAGT